MLNAHTLEVPSPPPIADGDPPVFNFAPDGQSLIHLKRHQLLRRAFDGRAFVLAEDVLDFAIVGRELWIVDTAFWLKCVDLTGHMFEKVALAADSGARLIATPGRTSALWVGASAFEIFRQGARLVVEAIEDPLAIMLPLAPRAQLVVRGQRLAVRAPNGERQLGPIGGAVRQVRLVPGAVVVLTDVALDVRRHDGSQWTWPVSGGLDLAAGGSLVVVRTAAGALVADAEAERTGAIDGPAVAIAVAADGARIAVARPDGCIDVLPQALAIEPATQDGTAKARI